MSEQDHFTNHCQSCGGGIEFPVNGVGEQIECPHCHTQLMLMFPSGSNCDPIEQIEVFLKTSSFPTKRAELLLLSKYNFPTEANNPPQLEMWRNALKNDPANVLDRFLSERFLQEANLDPTALLQSKSSNELKAMAKERGLPFSGTKETLAKRLTKTDPGGMAQLFRGKVYLTCSPKGHILVEKFRQAEKLMQERTEKKSFELLKNGELKEGCMAVAAYEASRAFPRGVGMDWGKYDCRHDLNVLQIIFTARLSRQARFDENTMANLRLAAAMITIATE
jgi:hypothetical protein